MPEPRTSPLLLVADDAPRLTRTLTVRVTEDVAKRIEAAASELNVPLSVVHRRLLDVATAGVL